MARLEHKAQIKRWKAKPEAAQTYALMGKALESGTILTIAGYSHHNSHHGY